LLQALARRGLDVRTVHVITGAQWRRQHNVAGSKSDRSDAWLLAEFGRVQSRQARPLTRVTDDSYAVRTFARAHEDLVLLRQHQVHHLRSALLPYYPAAVSTFPDLYRPMALVTLSLAPTPAMAARLRAVTLRKALAEAGVRVSHAQAQVRLTQLRSASLRLQPLSEEAAGTTVRALVRIIECINNEMEAAQTRLLTAFRDHPQAAVYQSFPALGGVLGARLLGEIGDDPSRFPSARHLCAYAGVSPITKASGLRETTHRRLVCNRRLNRALFQWTLPLLKGSPAAKALFEQRRQHGDRYGTATRNVANHYLRILHHCLRAAQPYDEQIAQSNYCR
jgi:transposase